MSRRKKKAVPKSVARRLSALNKNRWARVVAFLAGSGILVALLGSVYQYASGNAPLEYVQVVGRSYEFQLKNETPSDKTVKSFRIDLPRVQQVVYRVTEDIYANVDKDGQVTLPGGNISYVPAAEFKELDGQRLPANSILKFRVPPLSSRPWMQPEATIVDVHLELESSNLALRGIERLLAAVGLRSPARSVRYLVVDNYWTISSSTSLDEAIRVFCRDNDEMAKSSVCIAKH